MGLLIDSNVLISIERMGGDAASLVRGNKEESLFLSVVSASELLHGVHRAPDLRIAAKRRAFVEGIISAITLLDIDLAVARVHSDLWSDLERRGVMIGAHDAWIAATCLTHGLRISTANVREFSRIPGLEIEAWS